MTGRRPTTIFSSRKSKMFQKTFSYFPLCERHCERFLCLPLRSHRVALLFFEFVMHIVDIDAVDVRPTFLGDVVQIVDTTGGSVAVRGMVNRTLPQINRFLERQILTVVVVQNAVGKQRSRANGKVLTMETRRVVVDIVQLRTGLVPSSDHGAHAQTVSTVVGHRVGELLGGGGNRDAASVAKLIKATAHAEIAFPKGAVGGPTGHGTEQEGLFFWF
jgi:hypothetical protein